MHEYEIHKENIEMYRTLLQTMESEAEIIRVLILITEELQKRLEQKGIYCCGNNIFSWANDCRATLLKNILELKSIIGASFFSAVDNASLMELKTLISVEKNNIAALTRQITEMNKVSLSLVEHNLMLKKARDFLEG